MEFGEKVRQAREAAGMTQQSLAEKLYVTRQAVSRWECGTRYPDLLTAKSLADALHVGLEELLSDDAFQEFAEKQPILESNRAEQIQLLLFAAMSVLCLLNLGKAWISAQVFWLGAETDAAVQQYMLWKEIIFYGLLTAVSLYGTIKAFRQDVLPKVAGYTGCLYYLINGIHQIMMLLMLPKVGVQLRAILAAADIVFAGAIWLVFCRKQRCLEIPVCVLGMLTFLWRLTIAAFHLKGMLQNNYELQMYLSAFDYLAELAALGMLAILIAYETFILRAKRKRCG